MNLDNRLLTIMWTHIHVGPHISEKAIIQITRLSDYPNHFARYVRSIRKTTPAKKNTTV